MSKIFVAYWSGTGNTKKMAEMVADGIVMEGVEASVVSVTDMVPEELEKEEVFALGCPSMGAEVLEESVMEEFVQSVEQFAKGKKIALFGSYGWGDGQWMCDWEERMQNAGATIVTGEGLIVNNEPDEDGKSRCHELGRALASLKQS